MLTTVDRVVAVYSSFKSSVLTPVGRAVTLSFFLLSTVLIITDRVVAVSFGGEGGGDCVAIL